jgi:serine/threonine-protein kinase
MPDPQPTAEPSVKEKGDEAKGDDDVEAGPTSASPLSLRLNATRSDPPPPPLSMPEREEIARKKVGSTLKGWRLLRLLGTGRVTAAYEAIKGPGDGGERATLKLMIGNIAKHERARVLFVRGAYAANRFNHARVVPIAADGADGDGAPFVVRAWADAEPLSEIVESRDFDETAVLRMAEQILDALEIAHAHGVVHGAITPTNILVTPRGSIRLVDFATPPGMGPRSGGEEDFLAERHMSPFTPPEQCVEKPASASEQCDIWALAACMYFAVAKKPPRDATSREELAKATPKPLKSVVPKAGESFAKIVDYALAREPEARYESAYAMLGDVRRVLAGRQPKLGEASRPVPSGSFAAHMAVPPSSVRNPVLSSSSSQRGEPSQIAAALRVEAKRKQWRGNIALIMAIALLVGVATFVMVREKIEEQRRDQQEEPKK